MTRISIIVEGQTEIGFVDNVLCPIFSEKGKYLYPHMLGEPGKKGSVREFVRAEKEFLNLLKDDRSLYLTTMFDFYAMPNSWPGREIAVKAPFKDKKRIVEDAIKETICRKMGSSFDRRRFLPYIQMHEFEALLYTDPEAFDLEFPNRGYSSEIRSIRDQFNTPEEIDDDPSTAPSKRIVSIIPNYKKSSHGINIALRIGVEAMKSACPLFAAWLNSLESLGDT
jgi:hypothetical protein